MGEYINIAKDILEGIFGSKILVITFIFIMIVIVLMLIKVPLTITFLIAFLLSTSFLYYGLPVEVFIIFLIIIGFMVTFYILKEIAGK